MNPPAEPVTLGLILVDYAQIKLWKQQGSKSIEPRMKVFNPLFEIVKK
jgi:hypothetical protein